MEDGKQKVKDQILYLLKIQGAQSAAALATQLQVSPMAIRQHLQQLKAKQQVTYLEERRPLGRPVKLWQLTAQSSVHFTDSHADLLVDLLRSVMSIYGIEGLDRVIAERRQRQIETYRARLAASETIFVENSLENRWRHQVQAMARWRTQEGYMAEVIQQPNGTLLLIENHCPICTAARTCQQLCSAELETFRAVFGTTVAVERVEHILQGDRRCAYQIGQRASIESLS
jgi:predicted ArsR family transcriptional regulator